MPTCARSEQSWGRYLPLPALVLQQVQSAFSWFRTTLHAPHHCTGTHCLLKIKAVQSAPVAGKPASCGRWMTLENKKVEYENKLTLNNILSIIHLFCVNDKSMVFQKT